MRSPTILIKGNAYRVLVGKPERKRPLRRSRHRRKDNIKMDLKSVGKAWTGLIWLRKGTIAGSYECGNEPTGSIKCG
jgi:hypothetical protein